MPQENQLTELAGEIAVLREMLTLLKENLASLNEAVNQTRNPVISRQIKTIHLKKSFSCDSRRTGIAESIRGY